MRASSSVFDVNALKDAERRYRERLDKSPDNMELRLCLAWCLFMQSLHCAGQEEARRERAECVETRSDCSFTPTPTAGDAHALLEECLRQLYTVMHLSAQPQDRWSVEKLQTLMQLMGAQKSVLQAEERAAHILAELTGEIFPKVGADN